MNNIELRNAKTNRNDEFYTEISDVEFELKHYAKYFAGKTIYCNCDDPGFSAFTRFFHLNFKKLKLKKLICSIKNTKNKSILYKYTGGHDNEPLFYNQVTTLRNSGDFRDKELLPYLKETDIIVTNPPFSLFREFVGLMIKLNKDFIAWGNLNASTYKDVFPLIRSGKLHYGFIRNKSCTFRIPNSSLIWNKKLTNQKNNGYKYSLVSGITVYTTFNVDNDEKHIYLNKKFNIESNRLYDNFAAFEVSKSKEIPINKAVNSTIPKRRLKAWQQIYGSDLSVIKDNGSTVDVLITNPIYGVPITGLIYNFNPKLSILGIADRSNSSGLKIHEYTKDEAVNYRDLNGRTVINVNGVLQKKYVRVFVKLKND